MKTNEELNGLKEEIITLNEKLEGLTREELEQVTGGLAKGRDYWRGRDKKQNDNEPTDEE